ncbi:hypothetical protein, partial [Methylovulum sp.]|uniref:hypothetical protein n=1 Tax=Methylovulum sp. TaxID=1916980 RepID=UPI0026286EDC
IGAWLLRTGRTRIYLLDTNVAGNPDNMRQLSARLYVADPEVITKQSKFKHLSVRSDFGVGWWRACELQHLYSMRWGAQTQHQPSALHKALHIHAFAP